MFSIDKQSRVPVYEQIKNQVITLIRLGVFAPHDKLPSIRAVSAETSTNINTVKKAFAELELLGIIYTVPGTGCFAADPGDRSVFTAKALRDVREAMAVARAVGVTKAEIKALAEELYEGKEQSS